MKSLIDVGYALLSPDALQTQLGANRAELDALRPSWSRLPLDTYLRDGGHYRHRRHSCFIYSTEAGKLELTPHRAHWQSIDYNALHGGMERWFEPIENSVVQSTIWHQLLSSLAATFAHLRPVTHWYIEAHQFRIDTAEGIGRPTPEGAHRDGVDYVVVILVNRQHIKGGETRVFEAHGSTGIRFTMHEPWTALLLDDARVIHETTPILPEGTDGVRDTLVLTFREHGFQEKPVRPHSF